MKTYTLQELIDRYGLPLNVKKSWWFGDYYFCAEKLNSNGTVSGTNYRDGREYGKKSFKNTDEMILCENFQSENEERVSSDHAEILNGQIIVPGKTVLYKVTSQSECVKVTVSKFDIKNSKKVIFVKDKAKEEAFGYPECLGKYLFFSETDVKKIYPDVFFIDESMEFQKAKFTDDKSVYDEENCNLEHVEYKIDCLIDYEWSRYLPYKEEIESFEVYDWEDRNRLLDIKEFAESYKSRVNEYRDIKHSPYFMRVDIGIDNGDINTCFIGKKGVMDGDNIIVYDWQSPVVYAARFARAKKFSIHNHSCSLYLRRSIDIKNGAIELINTEYDAGAMVFSEELIDPFLLSILRDKRRDYKLTDIIRTIQLNQSEIISKPIDENFIVQGCAGSGKTMILLHRLSYLIYNHKNIDMSNYCILTPNIFFNVHINDLSKELGLEKIKRFTVEDYYIGLIKRLSIDDYEVKQVKDKLIKSPKIKIPTTEVKSEKTLNDQMLCEIYSDDYQIYLKEIYNSIWDSFCNSIQKIDFKRHKQSTTKAFPDLSNFTYDTYRKAKAFYDDLINVVTKNNNEINKAKEKLEKIAQRLPLDIKKLEKIKTEEIQLIGSASAKIKEQLKSLEQKFDETSKCIEKLQIEVKNLGERKKEIEAYSVNAFTMYELQLTNNELISIDYIMNSDSIFANYIKEQCKDQIAAINRAQNDLNLVPIYNFGKRVYVKRILEEANKSYKFTAESAIDEYKKAMEHRLHELQSEVQRISDDLIKKRETLKFDIENQKSRQNEILHLKNAIQILEINEPKTQKEDIPISDLNFVKLELERLKELFDERKKIDSQIKEEQECRYTIEQCEARGFDDSFVSKLSNLKELIALIDIKNIHQAFVKSLKTVYDKYKQSYKENDNYRHRIFILLYMCSLYYKDRRDLDKFVSIDEAQDIAVSEYRVLRDILGKECVFNLYGDVNQLVYSYKGISEWEALNDIISGNLYFLNENYRNTIQITEYCNNEFDAAVVAIGLNGDSVKSISLENAIEDIQFYHKENPNARTAVIYKKGLDEIIEHVISLMKKEEYSLNIVDISKISIITVEMAKGLEFENVVVIPDNMSVNEKYISFTRALEILTISNNMSEVNNDE